MEGSHEECACTVLQKPPPADSSLGCSHRSVAFCSQSKTCPRAVASQAEADAKASAGPSAAGKKPVRTLLSPTLLPLTERAAALYDLNLKLFPNAEPPTQDGQAVFRSHADKLIRPHTFVAVQTVADNPQAGGDRGDGAWLDANNRLITKQWADDPAAQAADEALLDAVRIIAKDLGVRIVEKGAQAYSLVTIVESILNTCGVKLTIKETKVTLRDGKRKMLVWTAWTQEKVMLGTVAASSTTAVFEAATPVHADPSVATPHTVAAASPDAGSSASSGMIAPPSAAHINGATYKPTPNKVRAVPRVLGTPATRSRIPTSERACCRRSYKTF